jgi:DNA polymerase V
MFVKHQTDFFMRFPATLSTSTFCFRMQGESMINAHIPDGALLIADRSVKPQSGMIVVAAVNGEYTVRRLVRTRKLLVLHADNPSFRPIPVTPEIQLEVHGVVTTIIIRPEG